MPDKTPDYAAHRQRKDRLAHACLDPRTPQGVVMTALLREINALRAHVGLKPMASLDLGGSEGDVNG